MAYFKVLCLEEEENQATSGKSSILAKIQIKNFLDMKQGC
jgi:hypothetical protein